MPASGPAQTEKTFPAAVLEDQEAIVSGSQDPVTLGMPPFSSPDPGTDGIQMVPLTGGTEEQQQAAAADAVPDEEKKAGDWVDVVKAAPSSEALDEVEERYSNSPADFKSVDDAIDRRRTELEEAETATEEEG
jgi:hypothetical protein